MPKGVEHCAFPAEPVAPLCLFSPLMPKGVEHRNRLLAIEVVSLRLFSPLMPKGVEHQYRYAPPVLQYLCFPL